MKHRIFRMGKLTDEATRTCPDCTAVLPVKAKFCSKCGKDFTGPWLQRQREGIPGMRRTRLASERESPEVGVLQDELAEKYAHGSKATLGEKTAGLILLIEEAIAKGNTRSLKSIYKRVMYEDADWGKAVIREILERKKRVRKELERQRKETK